VAAIGAYLRAAHLVPAVSVTALVGGAVLVRGAGPAEAVLAVASTAAGQLSVGWSNDYLDREEDRAAGRSEKPLVAGRIPPGSLWLGAWVVGAVSVGLAAVLGIAPAAAMAVAVSAAWGYNIGLKRTPLSWVPYAVAFGLAPVFVWLVSEGTLPPVWIPAMTAILGVAAHLTNVLPDIEVDRATRRTRGLPHLLGPARSLILAALLLGAALALVLWVAPRVGLGAIAAASASVLLIGAVVVAGLRGRARLAFLLTIGTVTGVVLTFLLSFRG
jgi:4-hydroxybenzoate polyprenyltransferase